jgi:RHS repeat-associated protein
LSYDNYGRPSVVSYPDAAGWAAFKTQYHYAANGDLQSLTDVPLGAVPSKLFWKAEARDPLGRILTEQFGNGTTTTYGIDQVRGVVTDITTTKGTTTLQSLSYSYDNNLNVMSRASNIPNALAGELFQYDALDRLITWQEVQHYGWNVSLTHDDIGNLTGRSLSNETDLVENLTFEHDFSAPNAGPHAITKSPWGTYAYDGKHNAISTPEGAISYTSFDLPKTITSPTNATNFKYDATGTRVSKSSTTAGTTVYVGGLYERRTVGGATQHVFNLIAGGRQIGQVLRKESDHSEAVEYIHADALGSSEVASDSSGVIIGDRRRYDPFGNQVDIKLPKLKGVTAPMSSNVHIGFTGQEEDLDTGLINMKGRIYNARVGHFLTPDPLISDSAHPAKLNPYAYVSNNPLKHTDPSGFEEEDPWDPGPCVGSCTLEGSWLYGGGGYPSAAGPVSAPGVFGSMGLPLGLVPKWVWNENHSGKKLTWELPSIPKEEKLNNGATITRLETGAWMRSDHPGSVYFQSELDHSYVGMSVDVYVEKSTYLYPQNTQDPNEQIINQKVRDFRGQISDNPNIPGLENTAASPSAIPVQSAPPGHPSTSPGSFFIPAMVKIPLSKDATDPKRPGESWLHYLVRMLTSVPGGEMLPLGAAVKGPELLAEVAKIDLSRAVVNPKAYVQLEKQLAEHGAQSIWNALDSHMRTLAKHVSKLPTLVHKSAVQKTIQNVSNQIETILQFIVDKTL